jgi:hypothetical protein
MESLRMDPPDDGIKKGGNGQNWTYNPNGDE